MPSSTCWLATTAWLCSCSQAVGSPSRQRFYSLVARDPDISWLERLQEPSMLAELQELADRDMARDNFNFAGGRLRFESSFGPNSDLAERPGDWTALVLLNKGRFNTAGCKAAPRTCAVLKDIAAHLNPSRDEEVGVRLLKLRAGATLRPHLGPGGRLVAHLGVRVPRTGAALTVAGQRVQWREGEITTFDDSLLHFAENLGDHARYVLHVAFPYPSGKANIFSVSTPHLKLDANSDCTVRVTNLRNGISSRSEPLLHLYNRVADNYTQNMEPCVSAQLVNSTTLKITAAHKCEPALEL